MDKDKLARFLTFFDSPNSYDCWEWYGPISRDGYEYDRVYVKPSGTKIRVCSICNKKRSSDWYYRNKAPVKMGGVRPL